MAAVQLGTYSTNVYLAYRSSSGPGMPYYNSIWGTRYTANTWISPFLIGGGTTPSAPSATYNPVSQTVYVLARGTDNDVWLSQDGMNPNTTWWPLDVTTNTSPSIASSSDGNMLVGYLDTSNNPWYRAYNSGGSPIDSFTRDTTGWQTIFPIFLSVVGSAVYALLTGYNNQVYYKEAYSG